MPQQHRGPNQPRSIATKQKEKPKRMSELFYNLVSGWNEEKGQGLVEYALIIVLVSIVCITALTALGSQVPPAFDEISGARGGGPKLTSVGRRGGYHRHRRGTRPSSFLARREMW